MLNCDLANADLGKIDLNRFELSCCGTHLKRLELGIDQALKIKHSQPFFYCKIKKILERLQNTLEFWYAYQGSCTPSFRGTEMQKPITYFGPDTLICNQSYVILGFRGIFEPNTF